MPPPKLEDVIFSEQATYNFSKILGDLKRSNLSITNRLRSIEQDAKFVEEVAETLQLPLVANERCGSWYIDPRLKAESAYFKSTDGHTNQWKFSTRRLNLHLLELIGKRDGIIIVDSTRRGKRMPDALSKTIPTWCAVLNLALFPSHASTLYTPPNTVSASEASQIEALLPSFLSSLLSLNPDLDSLRSQIRKPLRPMWVTQDDILSLGSVRGIQEGYHPVVCCTSSRRVVGTELGEGGYIQGAGDDTENWARGLTAELWWANRELLLGATGGGLEGVIEGLVNKGREGGGEGKEDTKEVVKGVWVGRWEDVERVRRDEGACVVVLGGKVTGEGEWVRERGFIEVGLGKGKIGSRNLRQALGVICGFVDACFRGGETGEMSAGEKKVVILCETGRDLSVGVALAVYCWSFDDDGNIRTDRENTIFNKAMIRVRLGRIMTAMPNANPNRATLQSVNSFLMSWRE